MIGVGSLVLGARVLLAAVFAVAGVAKLLDREGSRRSLAEFGVPPRLQATIAWLLPATEIAIAIALLPAGSSRWAAIAAAVLLVAFIAGIARAMARGRAPDCHCFGQLHSAPAGRTTLIRNSALVAVAAIVVAEAPGPSIGSWLEARTAAELVAVGAVGAAIGLALFAGRLWLERHELVTELRAAQEKLRGLPAGLPVGTMAPSFSLEDVHGKTHTLESLRARGNPVVLVFVHPDCVPCARMLPELARWQAALGQSLTVAPISTAEPEPTRAMAAEHGLELMLVGEDADVMWAFEARGTPTAVVVAADGTIASPAVSSLLAIEPLVRVTLRRDQARSVTAHAAPSSQP